MNAVADFTIRLAAGGERNDLEALQWRASLANEGDREAMLANPDASRPIEGRSIPRLQRRPPPAWPQLDP